MNKLKVQQAGGFPMETDTLDFMQTAYTIFNAIGELAGNLAIVSGCEKVGSQINSGTVYINGKLLSFRGGAVGTNVIIRQESTTRQFEDGSTKEVYQTRYATFGTGVTMYPWADFKRISNLQELKKTIDIIRPKTVPIGSIMMWGGSINNIPAGWHLCDGKNGTPDLRGRFIVGYNANDSDYSEVGKTGGNKNITTSGTVAPTNTSVDISNVGWRCGITGLRKGAKGNLLVASGEIEKGELLESVTQATAGKSYKSSHNHSFTGDKKDNRPPYYALAFIQFKGDN